LTPGDHHAVADHIAIRLSHTARSPKTIRVDAVNTSISHEAYGHCLEHSQVFVVVLAGLQAVVELAEEFVEQVSLGLVVPVSCGASGVSDPPGPGSHTP
jgi:hypothetical protein